MISLLFESKKNLCKLDISGFISGLKPDVYSRYLRAIRILYTFTLSVVLRVPILFIFHDNITGSWQVARKMVSQGCYSSLIYLI